MLELQPHLFYAVKTLLGVSGMPAVTAGIPTPHVSCGDV